MKKTLRTKNFNNYFMWLMITGLLVFSISGCQQQPPANLDKNNPFVAEKPISQPPMEITNINAPTANTNTETTKANTNAGSSNVNSTTAAANDKCGNVGDDEVIIYEHIFSQDGGGKCVKLQPGEYKDAAAMGLADNIMSSIRVGKNVHAVVCDMANFEGACMAFNADDDNFTNNATLKNDIASSVKVVKAQICSSKATEAMPIAWTNKTDKTLRINWVKTDCQEENNTREIKPGDVYNGSAGVGHIFHVTNFQTGEKYGYIYVNKSTATQDIKDIK